MKTGYSLKTVTFGICFTALSMSIAPVSFADKATPAPISYSDRTVTRSQAAQARIDLPPVSAPSTNRVAAASPVFGANTPLATDAKTRRLEFRYPDQPDTYYSANGSRSAGAAEQPLAFSSAEAAIAPSAAQAVAIERDPAILAGGFDARAEAAKIAQQQATAAPQTIRQPIRIAALTHQAPSATAKPFTVSRVEANPDASLSAETGKASIYSDSFDGHPTANGEVYDKLALTAAHRTLPLPSLIHVTNPKTQKEIVVRVNDRGPFDGSHILELSPRAGEMLGIENGESADISLRYLGDAPVKTVDNFANRSVEQESLPALEQLAPTPQPLRVQSPQVQPVAFTPADTSGIFIQAGAFSDISNAQRLSASLSPFHTVSIEEARVNGADYFRVMVGPFSNRAEADYQRQQMAFDGLADGFITSR